MSSLAGSIELNDTDSGKGGRGEAGGRNTPGTGSTSHTGSPDDTDDSGIESAGDQEVGGSADQAGDDITVMHELKSPKNQPEPHDTDTTEHHSGKGNASPNVDSGPINNDRGA